jgi:hypothetical protein
MPAALSVPWTAIATQASAGATLESLSEHWGIPLNTLKARSAREGWKATGREIMAQKTGTEVVGAGNSTLQPNATERSVSLMKRLGERSKYRAARVGHSMLGHISKVKGLPQVGYAQPFSQVVGSLAKVHGWGSEGGKTGPLVNLNLIGASFEELKDVSS